MARGCLPLALLVSFFVGVTAFFLVDQVTDELVLEPTAMIITRAPLPISATPSPFAMPQSNTIAFGAIEAGQTVRGSIAEGERHAWTFDGVAGDTISITLDDEGSGFDHFFTLVGPDGAPVDVFIDHLHSATIQSFISAFNLPVSGPYTIEVHAHPDIPFVTGDYALTFANLTLTTATPIPSNTPFATFEPSPTLPPPTRPPLTNTPLAAAAQTVERGTIEAGQTVRGSVAEGERHAWTFEGEAGDVVSIVLDDEGSFFDHSLTLLGPDGREADATVFHAHEATIQTWVPDYSLPTNGTYTIEVHAHPDFPLGTGDYALTLTNLRLTTATPSPTQTHTPTFAPPTATATPVSVANPATLGDNRGEIAIGGGEVWFYQGSAGDVISISVIADNTATRSTTNEERLERGLLDTTVSVRDSAGNEIAFNDDNMTIENSTDSLIDGLVLPEDGIYAIEVRSWENRSGGAYTLKIVTGSVPTATTTPTPTLTPSA
ncbi:MAG: hypothetical protein D6737_05860 [Chloroflexi bacterium]|nr:MAG: hypothetical protein D6737_05860 [Chloroflexota bacterium]